MSINELKKQIPTNIFNDTQIIFGDDISIIKPNIFITDMVLESNDYNIVITPNKTPLSRIENKEYVFGRKRIIVFNPETKLYVINKVPPQRYTQLFIDKNFLQNVSMNAFGKKNVLFSQLENPLDPMLLNYISNYEYELVNYQKTCNLMVQSMAYQIVIHLLRTFRNNIICKNEKYSGKENYISKALEYMNTYYNANININDICKDINLSPYHFIRMFKEKTGYTPHEYLLLIRIKYAEELLIKRNCSIDEVSSLCGFVNQGHFATQFKKAKGISPSKYRKMYYTTYNLI